MATLGWALALSLTALPGCTTDPRIEGPTRLVVGQHVTLQLERGDSFVDGELTLTDSSGFDYTPSDPLLDYRYIGEKELRFTIPYGIASGPALVSVGAKGRDNYEFDVEIVRLFGTLTTTGTLTFYDLDAPEHEYASTQVGSGLGTIGLSAAGDQLIAVSQENGVVYFLELGADALTPFAPSLDLGFPLQRGALVSGGALVAADHGVAFISRTAEDQLVLEEWLETGPVVSIAAAADTGRAVAAGTTSDASPVDFLVRLNLATLPPEITPPNILIGGSAGGVSDVAIDPAGELAVAVNSLDDTLVEVPLTAQPVVPQVRPLPEGNTGPTRAVMARRGNYLGVICPASKTVAVFSVANGSLAPLATVAADPRASEAKDPVDVGFAPPDRMLILLSDGAVAHVDLSASTPEATLVRDVQTSAGAAIVVQP